MSLEPLLIREIPTATSSCCSPCLCQVCLCAAKPVDSSGSVSHLADDKVYFHVNLRINLANSSGGDNSGTFVETMARRLKRSILHNVMSITRVIELSRLNQELKLRCETRALDALTSPDAKERVSELCAKTIASISGVNLVEIMSDEEIMDLRAHSEVERSVLPKFSSLETRFEVLGMTCASCVNTIEHILKDLDAVVDASVSLMLKSVTVKHTIDITPEEIKNRIENCGFEVSRIISIPPHSQAEENSFTAELFLRVDGMSCTSCVNTIETALSKRRGVKQISVNLLTKTAKVVIDPNLAGVRELANAIDDMGFEAHVVDDSRRPDSTDNSDIVEVGKLRALLLKSVFFALPTFIISMVIDMLLSHENPWHIFFMEEIIPGLDVTSLALLGLATPVQFWLGFPFYKSAYGTLKYTGNPNMDALIVLGTTVAYLASVFSMGFNISHGKVEQMTFFETGVFLITFVYLGRFLEAYAKSKTTETMSYLLTNKVENCFLVKLSDAIDEELIVESESEIHVNLLQVGDIFRVPPNRIIPADGVLVSGNTAVDESMLTGESLPVSKRKGSAVLSGTMNLSSSIYVKAFNVGRTTTLQKIVDLVAQAQSRKADIQLIADLVSRYFVGTIVFMSLLTFLVWAIAGWLGYISYDLIPVGSNSSIVALLFSVSVLVIACPCALGLATPTAVMVGTGSAAKYGILVKEGGVALEKASQVDAVVFDKTGTLTSGRPVICDVAFGSSLRAEQTQILGSMIKALSSHSDHPLSRAIAQSDLFLMAESLNFLNANEIPGKGIFGEFEGKKLWIGNEKWILQLMGSDSSKLSDTTISWKNDGKSVVVAALQEISDSHPYMVCAMSFSDPIRPEIPKVLRSLESQGISVWLLSGDNAATVHAVGLKLGITHDRIFAGVLPNEKAEKIKTIQRTASWTRAGSFRIVSYIAKRVKRHHSLKSGYTYCDSEADGNFRIQDHATVLFVGDGSNDAVALAQADVGVAMGTGTDLALTSASVLLLKSSLNDLLLFLWIAKKTVNQIYMNFFYAGIYNICGIPLAAGVLYPMFKVKLPPEFAGLAMALSSVSVVFASLTLRWRVDRHVGQHVQ